MNNPLREKDMVFRKFAGVLAALALSALVAGCADVVRDQREPTAASIIRTCQTHIAIAGRFSASYRKDGWDEAMHGNFEWVQSGKISRITLLSPLGQTIATLDVTPEAATLTSAGKPPRVAADADTLAAESLGWPLPVSGLGDWLQGCALDAKGRRFVAQSADSKVITRDGWNIAYPVWEDETGMVRRPKRIDLNRAANSVAAEISLRIVIDSWQPNGNKNGK